VPFYAVFKPNPNIPRGAIEISMKPFDSLDAAGANELMRRPVLDIEGRKVGTLEYVWIDPSTHRVEFVGLKTGAGLGNVNVVPARVVDQDNDQLKVLAVAEFVRNGPTFAPPAELPEFQKQQINQYYGHFVPIRRASAIEELRPEEKAEASAESQEADRGEIEQEEQSFFKQKGFVTDSMPEVDASAELKYTAEQAKIREDEHERGHGG
jgi:sporulation protein YlmC with PRC-barrel domain